MANHNIGYRPKEASQAYENIRTGGYQSNPKYRKQNKRPPKQSRRMSARVKALLVLLAVTVAALLGVMLFVVINTVEGPRREETFYRGVYVDDIPLHGKQFDEAVDLLYARAGESLRGWSVALAYGEQQWTVDTHTLGMDASLHSLVEEEVKQAYQVGREEGNLFQQFNRIQDLRAHPYMGYTGAIHHDTQKLDALLSEIDSMVSQPPQNASWSWDTQRRNPVVVTDEVYGKTLDRQALKAEINRMVSSRTSGTISIEPTEIAPEVTSAMLDDQVVLLADFATEIDKASTKDRNTNIDLGCTRLHGRVMSPGDKLSFNRVVGERTEKNGYKKALEIVRGSYEEGVGGGICQVSSTLYNAVIEAGLEVIERTNHGVKVGYLDMGYDATVADGRYDFIFRNNTDADIYLVARVETTSSPMVCRVQIYGRPDPDGYTYRIRTDRPVENEPIPDPITVKDQDGLYVKYTDRTHEVSGKPGYKVRRYLVVEKRNGDFVREEALETDVYRPVAPRIFVGVQQRGG